MHYKLYIMLFVSAMLLIGSTTVQAAVTLTQQAGKYLLENDYLRLSINPANGGKIDGYFIKATGRQLLDADTGLLADHFWQQTWPGEFFSAPYEAKIISQTPDAVTVEVARVAKGYGGSTAQNDLRLARRITLTAASPLLYVELSLQNVGTQGRVAGYWGQNILYANGDKEEKQLFFRPAVRGVSECSYQSKTTKSTMDSNGSEDGFVREPQNGWMALLGADSHNGMAFVMKYDELMYLYNCWPQFTTEWQYKNAAIPAGKTWKTDFVLYPVTGLPRVDFASRNVVVAVQPGDANGTLTVNLQLAAAGAKLENVTISGKALLVRKDGHTELPFAEQHLTALTNTPLSATFTTAHDPLEPLALHFTITGILNGQQVSDTFETWYGAKYGWNNRVDLNPVYNLPLPERHISFLKPDKIEKIHNQSPRVLFCKGLFQEHYLPAGIFTAMKADVVSSYFKPASTFPASLTYTPASYDDLMAFDTVALINIDADALGDSGLEMLKDFVNYGGTLLYGGDVVSYQQGHVIGNQLAALLPVTFVNLKREQTLRFFKGGKALNYLDGGKLAAPFAKDAVMMYAANKFTVKNGAKVLLTAGDDPVVVSWNIGKGRVIAITGSVLGVAPHGKTLYTLTPEWANFMAKLLGGQQ